MKKITTRHLQALKKNKTKFATVALYDAPMAAMAEKCDIPVVLVGDSLGMTMLGYDSTIPVTMEHMIYHIEAVSRGNKSSFIIGDLPFMSYATADDALKNSTRVMQAGAHMVKLEGGKWLADTVKKLTDCGIPVCAHLGLLPQSVNKLGGFRVQGKTSDDAEQIYRDALLMEKSGADLIVLECIPEALAKKISETLTIPVIGIGAGSDTDAQILVINDILGLTETPPKFSKNFLVESEDIPGALRKYVYDVEQKLFPDDAHVFL